MYQFYGIAKTKAGEAIAPSRNQKVKASVSDYDCKTNEIAAMVM